jgi:predicted GNAT superfamily acetyltransferase
MSASANAIPSANPSASPSANPSANPPAGGAVEIRALERYEEMQALTRVQRAIWGFADETGIYPPSLLAFAENGGLVLGAFDPAGEMVGFCFGFLARHWDGRLKLHSQATGVLRDYRGSGLAQQLKRRQREWALGQGLALITWTYDPLEMPNARLNIARLGGLVRRYRRNVYGEQFGRLNAGLPSDRFVVEWELDSPRVRGRLAAPAATVPPDLAAAEPVDEVATAAGRPRLIRYNTRVDAPLLRVDLLPDLQALKTDDLALALEWRLGTRELFEAYFARGYAVTDFVSTPAPASEHSGRAPAGSAPDGREAPGERRNAYLLRRAEEALRA